MNFLFFFRFIYINVNPRGRPLLSLLYYIIKFNIYLFVFHFLKFYTSIFIKKRSFFLKTEVCSKELN